MTKSTTKPIPQIAVRAFRQLPPRYFAYLPNGCIEWQGQRDRNAYGLFFHKKKQYRAHRVHWVANNGPIPRGLFCLHKCDNPRCLNLDHIFLGTQTDNMHDRKAKGRYNTQVSGLAHPNALHSAEDIHEIRRLAYIGISQHKLADMYKTSQGNISRIVRGLSYPDVGGPISPIKLYPRAKGVPRADVIEAYRSGLPIRDIGARFDLSEATIHLYLRDLPASERRRRRSS